MPKQVAVTDKHLQKFAETPQFSIGQKAFIIDSSKRVLIIKRHQQNTLGNRWDLPGGRLDYQESIRDGLVREVYEEVGLTVNVISFPLSITTFLNSARRQNQVVRVIYLCTAEGTVQLSEEHDEFRWIEPPSHLEFTFPDDDYHQAFENFLKISHEPFEFVFEGILEESANFLKQNVSLIN
jgi:8-oxo-dGTP pyrophosphatase MutT (NUDIX family)